jgi:hypothetical protein
MRRDTALGRTMFTAQETHSVDEWLAAQTRAAHEARALEGTSCVGASGAAAPVRAIAARGSIKTLQRPPPAQQQQQRPQAGPPTFSSPTDMVAAYEEARRKIFGADAN